MATKDDTKEDVKAASKTEKTTQKAETKNERTTEKASVKNEKTAAKNEKITEETPTEEVTPEAPKSARRSASQDSPEESQRSAVNDAAPKVETNRFSGIYPDNAYPLVEGALDAEQEQRKQARDESTRTRRVSDDTTPRDAHPPLAWKYSTNDHATRTADAQADIVA